MRLKTHLFRTHYGTFIDSFLLGLIPLCSLLSVTALSVLFYNLSFYVQRFAVFSAMTNCEYTTTTTTTAAAAAAAAAAGPVAAVTWPWALLTIIKGDNVCKRAGCIHSVDRKVRGVSLTLQATKFESSGLQMSILP